VGLKSAAPLKRIRRFFHWPPIMRSRPRCTAREELIGLILTRFF